MARTDMQWRNTLFAMLFVAEASLLLSTTPASSRLPRTLTSIFPVLGQPPFLQIRFLHRIFTSLTQLAGIWVVRPNEERIMAEVQSVVQRLHLEGEQCLVVWLLSFPPCKYRMCMC